MRHGGGGCCGGVHGCSVCGPESGPARRSGYYIEVAPVERTESGGRCASAPSVLVFRPAVAALRTAAALLLLAAGAASVVAQPATRSGAAAAPALDRREFPFFPLQAAWSLDLELAASVAPTIGPSCVFIAFANGNIGCYNLINGRGLWAVTLRAVQGLVLDDPRLLVTTDGAVEALHAADGTRHGGHRCPRRPRTRRSRAVDGPSSRLPTAASPPCAATRRGRVDACRSAPSPSRRSSRAIACTRGWPTVCCTPARSPPGPRSGRRGSTAPSRPWPRSRGTSSSPRPTAGCYALDGRDGKIRWRYRIGASAIGLAVDEDRVIAVMLDQSVRAFKIGGGAQAWRYPLSFRPAAGPIVVGASVLVTGYAPTIRILHRRTGADQGLYAMPLAVAPGGVTLETLATGPLIRLGPTLFDDQAVLLTQHGFLHGARRPSILPPRRSPCCRERRWRSGAAAQGCPTRRQLRRRRRRHRRPRHRRRRLQPPVPAA